MSAASRLGRKPPDKGATYDLRKENKLYDGNDQQPPPLRHSQGEKYDSPAGHPTDVENIAPLGH